MAEQGRAVCLLVSAVLARGVCAVIFQCFYAAEIAAAKMLLFFRELAAMDILTMRVAGARAVACTRATVASLRDGLIGKTRAVVQQG